MGTRTSDVNEHQVSLELTHPQGPDGQRAELRVIDGPSGLTVVKVEIPPEVFYKLLAGVIDGQLLPALLLQSRVYQRIGRRRHHWTRNIGFGVTLEDAEVWAIDVMDRLGLDTWSVSPRRGGLSASWELWINTTDQETLDGIRDLIETLPLPERRPLLQRSE